MQEFSKLSPVQRELEESLMTLSPPRPAIDAISAAFAAGQRSGRGQVRRWQSAAGLLLLAAVAPWVIRVQRVSMETVHPTIPSMAVDSHASPMPPLPSQSVLMLEQSMRANGLEGLPEAPVPAVQMVRPRDVL